MIKEAYARAKVLVDEAEGRAEIAKDIEQFLGKVKQATTNHAAAVKVMELNLGMAETICPLPFWALQEALCSWVIQQPNAIKALEDALAALPGE